MKPKTQRLTLALLAVAAIAAAALLALSALKDQAAYFYTPSDAAKAHLQPGAAVRLGGMVEKGSLKRLPDGVTISFMTSVTCPRRSKARCTRARASRNDR